MLNTTITWNGVSSDTLGIRVERFPNLNRPQRKYEQVSVPGRNGDLFFFQDAWNNYEQAYDIFAGNGQRGNSPEAYAAIMQWLYPAESSPTIDDYINLTVGGYHRLIDSNEPNSIRLATFSDSVNIENSWNRRGQATLRFNCRPERFTSDAFSTVDMSDAVSTESGSIVSFDDGAEAAVNAMTVDITAKQGSGTPSPTNVLPITGWSSVKIYRTGKNLLPYPYYQSTITTNGITFTDNGDGTIRAKGTATGTAIFYAKASGDAEFLESGKSYTISGCPSGGSSSTYKLDIVKAGSTGLGTDFGSGATFTYPEGQATQVRIVIYSGQGVDILFKPNITLASEYSSISISLGQTVYGGTLDVVSGLLTVDRKYVEYDGSADEPWAVINYGYRISLGTGNNGVTNSTKNIANWMVQADSAHNPTSSAGISGTFMIGGYVNINVHMISSITDVTTLKTYLASNPLQVVYELATPLTYQLTETEIKTLLGENRIWADTGDISVTYRQALVNPGMPAKPFLKVYGSGNGTVIVNGYVITITGMTDYLHIDCESQNCFRLLAENRNSLISLTNGFPVLSRGANTIIWTGGITKVEIVPRWWRL